MSERPKPPDRRPTHLIPVVHVALIVSDFCPLLLARHNPAKAPKLRLFSGRFSMSRTGLPRDHLPRRPVWTWRLVCQASEARPHRGRQRWPLAPERGLCRAANQAGRLKSSPRRTRRSTCLSALRVKLRSKELRQVFIVIKRRLCHLLAISAAPLNPQDVEKEKEEGGTDSDSRRCFAPACTRCSALTLRGAKNSTESSKFSSLPSLPAKKARAS
eukprot:scaffold602_cov298-Pinguiococcus_pyrenoidosus.AAC.31